MVFRALNAVLELWFIKSMRVPECLGQERLQHGNLTPARPSFHYRAEEWLRRANHSVGNTYSVHIQTKNTISKIPLCYYECTFQHGSQLGVLNISSLDRMPGSALQRQKRLLAIQPLVQ